MRDGLADTVRCGDGADRVDADGFDSVAGDCEAVSRTATAAPPDAGRTATDTTAPTVDASAVTLQRLGSRGVVKVVGTSSERGTLGASGYIDGRRASTSRSATSASRSPWPAAARSCR